MEKRLTKKDIKQVVSHLKEGNNGKASFHWDQGEELGKDYIEKIMLGRIDEVYEEIDEMNIDARFEYEDAIIENAMRACGLDWMDFDKQQMREEFLDYTSVDMNMENLLKRTSANVRLTMYSNYDCINSFYYETQAAQSYGESYLGAMIDSLNLNPKKVKEIFQTKGVGVIGSWPDKKGRDGKEYVTYSDFFREFENTSCGANNLVFVAKLDLSDLIGFYQGREIGKVTIPKGNNAGMFSSFQGGGSIIEMELQRDFTVDLRKHGATKYDSYGIELDGDSDYSINQVYGVTRSFWGSEASVQVVDKKEDKKPVTA